MLVFDRRYWWSLSSPSFDAVVWLCGNSQVSPSVLGQLDALTSLVLNDNRLTTMLDAQVFARVRASLARSLARLFDSHLRVSHS